ncbi:VIP36-like protein [Acromyrmex echinatior]|uniref:VIP36-like protein n=1 Tax=Acromyrmex echinatior TaxID=103372 RepID=F4X4B2_ACREC|nr:VIP36-like protein [Acromyrmex echinatior]
MVVILWLLLLIGVLESFATEWNTQDYMKREHSLIRPYQDNRIYLQQHQHPYISAMVNNGSLHYDHDRDGTHTQLAGCEAKFRNLEYDTHISIRYERDILTERVEDLKQHSWSGIKLFLLMLLGALVLIACVVIIIMLHKKHQENARKRFY